MANTLAKRVSVAAVIPLYNGAPFIREALQSVFDQSEPADEIIVVDDGSADDGPAIVEAMAKDRPVRLVRKTNGGQSSARNLGVAQTTSSHIAFLDQDDIWYRNHLAGLKRPFRASPLGDVGLVHSNVDQIDSAGRLLARNYLDALGVPQPKQTIYDCLRYDAFTLPSASMFSRAAFTQLGGFDENLVGYEDDDLCMRLFIAGHRIVYVGEALSRWRVYGESTSYGARMAQSRMVYARKLMAMFPDQPRLNFFYVRDMIAPRFLSMAYNELINASRLSDPERSALALRDINELVRVSRPKIRRRFARFAPVLDFLCRHGRFEMLRVLARRAIRPEDIVAGRAAP